MKNSQPEFDSVPSTNLPVEGRPDSRKSQRSHRWAGRLAGELIIKMIGLAFSHLIERFI